MGSSEPAGAGTPEKPRAWWPLVTAVAVALAVVVGAFVFSAVSGRLSAGEASAARVCEAAYAAGDAGDTGGGDAGGGDGSDAGSGAGSAAAIVAGDIYTAAEWRDLRDFLSAQGLLDSAGEDVTEAIAADADARAADLAEQGKDHITVVWWLESEEYLVCEVDTIGDEAQADSVSVASLASLASLAP